MHIILTVLGTVDKIRRLMSTDQSRTINPQRLAKSGECLTGAINLDKMSRLTGLLQDYSGEIDFRLSFNIDEEEVYFIESEISGRVVMECQRCLEPVVVEIHRQSLLGIANDNDVIKILPQRYEPLLVENELLSVSELVEDELLLVLPLAPVHLTKECQGSRLMDEVNANAKPSPFAVLADIKKSEN